MAKVIAVKKQLKRICSTLQLSLSHCNNSDSIRWTQLFVSNLSLWKLSGCVCCMASSWMLFNMYKMVAIKLLVTVTIVELLLWWYSCQHINKYTYILHLVCFHADHIQNFYCILILFILQSVTWGAVAIVTVIMFMYFYY